MLEHYDAGRAWRDSPTPLPPAWRRWRPILILVAVLAGILGILGVTVRYMFLLSARAQTAAIVARLDATDPGWTLEDIEAGRDAIPAEEDSAPTLEAVIAGVPAGWGSPGPSVPRNRETDRTAAVLAAVDRRSPNRRLGPELADRLRAELERLGPALPLARTLADRPRGHFSIQHARNPLMTPLPQTAGTRTVAYLLCADARLRAEEGDLDGALASCLAAAHCGRAMWDEPASISQYVRIANVGIALRAAQGVLGQGSPSADSLLELQRLLDDEQRQPLLRIAARAERGMLDALWSRMASGEISMKSDSAAESDMSPLAFWSYGEALLNHFRGVALEEMTRAVGASEAPESAWLALFEAHTDELADRESSIWDRPAVIMLPAMDSLAESALAHRARLRTTIVGLAAERFRLDRGRLPESAEELAPGWLDRIPDDPFTGEPLRVKRLDDGLVIYSVGVDMLDNGGNDTVDDRAPQARPRSKYRYGTDILFRLWDHRARGRPEPEADGELPDDVFRAEDA